MLKKNAQKKITAEELARMVARGFENTATKDDLKELATQQELTQGLASVRQEMRSGFQVVTDTLDLIRSDIRDLKISVEIDAKDLKHRVERLEKKVGLSA